MELKAKYEQRIEMCIRDSVYTHTIFELHKRYGINKFIIAVPSIAIKAGTSTFLNETYVKAHFKNKMCIRDRL